jgi:actin-related protein 6
MIHTKGLPQLGIAAAVKEAISKLPVDFGNMAWSNIGLIGGNCLFPGFVERLWVPRRAYTALI